MTETIPKHGVGRKHLKGWAGNIAHMFASSAEHYAWLAYNYQIPVVTIDLLTLRIEPSEFDIERNRILAGNCRQTLLRNGKSLTPPGSVIAAVLHASFGIDGYRVEGQHTTLGESLFTVVLTDDRCKEWRGEHREERMLAVGWRNGQIPKVLLLIPPGNYCYRLVRIGEEVELSGDLDNFGKELREYRYTKNYKEILCPYWQRTDYGTVRCNYLDKEVLDKEDGQAAEKVKRHLGISYLTDAPYGRSMSLPDEIKLCRLREDEDAWDDKEEPCRKSP